MVQKTVKIELEELKEKILERIAEEEIGLWHGSDLRDAGWNNALSRVEDIIRYEM